MSEPPFVVFVGTQSSGSSAIAGVAYHLGVWLGNNLGGRYGHNPNYKCGFEDDTLITVIRKFSINRPVSAENAAIVELALRERFETLTREASERGQIPGSKRPRFSVMGPMLTQILGDRLRVIDCHRPLKDSVESFRRIIRGRPGPSRWYQQLLWDGKQRFLGSIPADRQLRVDYYSLLANPAAEAQRMAAWLGLTPTPEQLARAVQSIDPAMRHVGVS